MSRLIRVACLLAMTVAPAFAQTPAVPSKPVAAAPASVPVKPPALTANPAAVPAATPALGRVDINGATEAQLDTLPGVGPARAQAIIANRPYAELSDITTRKVLPQSVFDGAKSRLALANINASSAADMAKALPGVGDVRAKAIVAGRPYATANDLVSKGVLTQAVFDKVKDLVAY